jgi:uncharacterized membrane protein
MTSLQEPLIPASSAGSADLEAARAQPGPEKYRDVSLDLMRGFIMLVMAWDHTTHQFTNKHDTAKSGGFEIWNGPFSTYDNSPRLFLSRAVSHVCAPGFFFTMGIGMSLFSNSRFEAGWSTWRVWRHFAVRGLVLLVCGRLVNFPGWLASFVDVDIHGRTVHDRNGDFHRGDEGVMLRDAWLSIFEVMEALGFTMMLAPMFLRAMQWAHQKGGAPHVRRAGGAELLGLFLFALFFAVSNVAIVLAQGADPTDTTGGFPKYLAPADTFGKVLARFLLYPGLGPKAWTAIVYPVVPWIGVACLGQGAGFMYIQKHLRASEGAVPRYRMLQMAGAFLGLFLLVRGLGGKVGNYRGWPRHDTGASGFMEFFIVCKYPPDLAYALITLAVDFLLIFLFSQPLFANVEAPPPAAPSSSSAGAVADAVADADTDAASDPYLVCARSGHWEHPAKPLLVFGRTPLFFYTCHFFVIGLLEAVCRLPDPPTGKWRLEAVLLVWAMVISIMYFACKRYGEFKAKTSVDSLWRLL